MKRLLLLLPFLFLFVQCTEDDDPSYDKSWAEEDFYGEWYINTITYEGRTQVIPIDYENCGPNYISINDDHTAKEYVYTSYECDYEYQESTWKYEKGKLIFNYPEGNLVWNILDINNGLIRIKVRQDVDQDGKAEDFIMTLKKLSYVTDLPSDNRPINFYLNLEENQQTLTFNWDEYKRNKDFGYYEIYLGNTVNDIDTRIAKIDDIKTTTFSTRNSSDFHIGSYTLVIRDKNGDKISESMKELYYYDVRNEYIKIDKITELDDQVKLDIQPLNSKFIEKFKIKLFYKNVENEPIQTWTFEDSNQRSFEVDKLDYGSLTYKIEMYYKGYNNTYASMDRIGFISKDSKIVKYEIDVFNHILPMSNGENIVITPYSSPKRYNLKNKKEYQIFEKNTSAYLSVLNPYNYFEDKELIFGYDGRLYFYDINSNLVTRTINVANEFSFYDGIIKLNDYIVINESWRSLKIYKLINDKLSLIVEKEINDSEDEVYRTGNDTFAIKINNNVYQEYEIKNDKLTPKQELYFEPKFSPSEGFVDLDNRYYVSFKDNVVYKIPTKEILYELSSDKIIGYNDELKSLYVSVDDKNKVELRKLDGTVLKSYETSAMKNIYATTNYNGKLFIFQQASQYSSELWIEEFDDN